MRFTEDHVRYFVDHNTRWSNLPFLKLCGTLQSTLADKNFAVSYVWFVIQHTNRTTTFEDPRPGGAKEGPKGAYGVPAQYERSFRWNCTFTIWLVRSNPVSDLPTLRWKLSQFRYLCQSNALPSHIKVRFHIRLTNFQMLSITKYKMYLFLSREISPPVVGVPPVSVWGLLPPNHEASRLWAAQKALHHIQARI